MAAAERLVLDTHVWKMLVDGDRFAPRVLRRIEAAGPRGNLYVASITIWEIAMLVQKGSLRLNRPTLDWVTTAVHESSVVVAPQDPAIAVDAADLRAFHGDPADRLIVATARRLSATLVTRDTKILEYAERTGNVRTLEPA